MAGELDKATIEIPCPGCGHQTQKTIGWLKMHKQLTCRGCGKVINLESNGFRKGMRQVDAEIDKLAKALQKGRRIKF